MISKGVLKITENRKTIHLEEGDTKLKKVYYHNRPVLTSQQLAEFLETGYDNIRRIFSIYNNRFKKDVDYFLLKGKDLSEFKEIMQNNEVTSCHIIDDVMNRHIVNNYLRINKLYLWTENSLIIFGKILNNNKAWKILQTIEKDYFELKKLGWGVRVSPKEEIESKDIRKEFVKKAIHVYLNAPNTATTAVYDSLFSDKFLKKINMTREQLLLLLKSEKYIVMESAKLIIKDTEEGINTIQTLSRIQKSMDMADTNNAIKDLLAIQKLEQRSKKQIEATIFQGSIWN